MKGLPLDDSLPIRVPSSADYVKVLLLEDHERDQYAYNHTGYDVITSWMHSKPAFQGFAGIVLHQLDISIGQLDSSTLIELKL
jgi:hypothetical protein